jgi:hypothetical protein
VVVVGIEVVLVVVVVLEELVVVVELLLVVVVVGATVVVVVVVELVLVVVVVGVIVVVVVVVDGQGVTSITITLDPNTKEESTMHPVLTFKGNTIVSENVPPKHLIAEKSLSPGEPLGPEVPSL